MYLICYLFIKYTSMHTLYTNMISNSSYHMFNMISNSSSHIYVILTN